MDRESYGNTVSAPSRITTLRRDEVDDGGSFLPPPVRMSHDYGVNKQPGKKLLGGGKGR